MANALSILDQAPPPSALDDELFGQGNIAERVTVPSVTFTGKVWTINYNGEKIKLEKRDEEGEVTPMPVMKVVILDYNKSRGRAYYEGEFDPDKPGAPVCWSDDGKTPHESVKEPQCGTCAKCPMAVKGSKITPQGKEVKACAEHRMIVVVPANGLGQFPPLRMKLAVTSDYDARSPELQAQGWYAFSNYMELLRARGVKHSARLVTKMKFDPNAAYPKVLFSVDRWLEDSEKPMAAQLSLSEDTKALLGGTFTPNGADGTKALPPANTLSQQAAAKAPSKPTSAPVVDDEDDEPAPKPVKKAEPVAKAVKKAPPPPAADEDDDDDIPAPKVVKKSKEPVVPVAMQDDLEALADEWGDD